MRKRSQQARMSYSSCSKAVKTLQLFSYKVHVIQQLIAYNCEKHNYCEQLTAEDDPHLLGMTFSSDEAWFPFCTFCEFTEYLHSVDRK
jgi:hypothetical protein